MMTRGSGAVLALALGEPFYAGTSLIACNSALESFCRTSRSSGCRPTWGCASRRRLGDVAISRVFSRLPTTAVPDLRTRHRGTSHAVGRASVTTFSECRQQSDRNALASRSPNPRATEFVRGGGFWPRRERS